MDLVCVMLKRMVMSMSRNALQEDAHPNDEEDPTNNSPLDHIELVLKLQTNECNHPSQQKRSELSL